MTVDDTVPTVTSVGAQTVGEDGLPDGNHIKGDIQTLSVTSSLDINWGADSETVQPGSSFGRTLSFLAGDDTTAIAGSNTPVTSLAMTISGEHGSALSSGGVALVYVISSNGNGGETLTATAGANGPTVFTLSLDPTAANGAYTFTLDRALDDAVGSNNIGLTFTVQATDADGDAVNQSFTVNVQDDVPVAGVASTEKVFEANLLFDGSSPDFHDLDRHRQPRRFMGRRQQRFRQRRQPLGQLPARQRLGRRPGHRRQRQRREPPDLERRHGPVPDRRQRADRLHQQRSGSTTRVFNVTLNDDGSGSYTFTLLNNLDHPAIQGNNNLNFTFDFTATDSDGDPVNSTFTVTVVDDVPTAGVGDATSVNEANLPHGNFPLFFGLPVFPQVTGDLHITWGADDNLNIFDPSHSRSVTFTNSSAALDVSVTDNHGNAVTGLTSNGNTINYAFLGGELVGYTGSNPHANQVFTVALSSLGDGSYTFTLLQTLDDPSGSNALKFTFNYTATDSDGDTSPNTFSVTVNDDTPIIGSTVGDVSEDKPLTLTNAPLNMSFGADNGTFAGSHLGLAFTDRTVAATDVHGTAVALTYYGNAISTTFINGELVGYIGTNAPTSLTDSHIVFTATLSANGTYDFALKQPLDNPAPVNGNTSLNLTFDITATDADGSTASGHFTVNVDAAGSTGTPGVIDYSHETTGVFVNLSGVAVTFGGQTVAAHTATDLASGGGHVIGIDQLGAITGAIGGSANDVIALSSTEFAAKPQINGGGGTNTLLITDTTSATIVDAEFANVSHIQTLKISPDANQIDTITLGVDASKDIGTGTLLVDASAESFAAITTVDFTAMTAKFAFVGGSEGKDTVIVTNAQFESGLSLSVDTFPANDRIIIADASNVTDAAFLHVTKFETLQLGDFTNSVTLGTNAAADALSGGLDRLIIDGANAGFGHDLTVDATGYSDANNLTLEGGAGDDLLKMTAAQFASGKFFVDGGAGTDTIDLVDTASFSVADSSFASTHVANIETLEVAPGAGGTATVTLGTNASAEVGAATFTVDASGESATGSTVVDFSAMTANFAFDGGAGNDSVSITSTQFATAPHIAGGGGSNTLVITDTGFTVVDADFANVSNIQTLKIESSNVTLGADASADIGTGILLVDASAESFAAITTVDFTAMTGKFAFVGGSEGGDTVTVTNAQFESGLSLSSVSIPANDRVIISDAATITDAAFVHVTQFETLQLGDFTNSVTLGANAAADALSTGFDRLVINGIVAGVGHDLTVDATGYSDANSLSLGGGAGDDLFKMTAAQFASGKFFVDGGAGIDTIDLVDTASFSVMDGSFASGDVANIETLEVAPGAGGTATITPLGTDASAEVGLGTFTVDASRKCRRQHRGELHRDDLEVAFDGGAGNDKVSITSTQFEAAPQIAGGNVVRTRW